MLAPEAEQHPVVPHRELRRRALVDERHAQVLAGLGANLGDAELHRVVGGDLDVPAVVPAGAVRGAGRGVGPADGAPAGAGWPVLTTGATARLDEGHQGGEHVSCSTWMAQPSRHSRRAIVASGSKTPRKASAHTRTHVEIAWIRPAVQGSGLRSLAWATLAARLLPATAGSR